jgi:glycerol-3-phosphate acyltransferase PlsY
MITLSFYFIKKGGASMSFLLFLIAYLIGSIPTALLIGKYFFHIDIREHGSNNPGATNSLRVLGKKAAIGVLMIDVGKGTFAALLPQLFSAEINPIYIGLAAVAGHCFPIFAGFRGGKAIATTAGVLLVYSIPMLLVAYLTFFGVILVTKYVFLGSISVGASLLIYSAVIGDYDLVIVFGAFTLFLLFLHRSNIINFTNKKEPKINDKNLKKDRIKHVPR